MGLGDGDIRLRPATMDDACQLLAWQRHPETRRHFNNPRPPGRDEHIAWMARALGDRESCFTVIEKHDVPVGVLRLDSCAGEDRYVVSILVDPDRHGEGIATAALSLGRMLRPFAVLEAHIQPENTASLAVFHNAGYQNHGDVYLSHPNWGHMPIAMHPDGATGAGMGHVGRCLALGSALAEVGATPVFMVSADSPYTETIRGHGFPTVPFDGDAYDLAEAVRGARALVVDSYRIDMATIAQRRQGSPVLVRFDDNGRERIPDNVLVIDGSPANAQNVGSDRSKLLGPRYQVIRRDLLRKTNHEREPRRVLVSFGAMDPRNLAGRVVALLRDRIMPTQPEIVADIVLGPETPLPRDDFPSWAALHHQPDDLPALMASADIAVSGGGQTLLELVYCGVPTVASCLSDNQRLNVEALAKAGCILSAGDADAGDWADNVTSGVVTLLRDDAVRASLVTASSGMFDGRGQERIASAIMERCGMADRRCG